MISMAMEIITKCMQEANETVSQVVKDDRLKNIIINTTSIITPGGEVATIIDADSRDEVRNVAASLIEMLSNVSMEVEEDPDTDDVKGE